jgi:hypothetical protein
VLPSLRRQDLARPGLPRATGPFHFPMAEQCRSRRTLDLRSYAVDPQPRRTHPTGPDPIPGRRERRRPRGRQQLRSDRHAGPALRKRDRFHQIARQLQRGDEPGAQHSARPRSLAPPNQARPARFRTGTFWRRALRRIKARASSQIRPDRPPLTPCASPSS